MMTKHSMIVTYKCNLKNVVKFVIWKQLKARDFHHDLLILKQALLEVEIEVAQDDVWLIKISSICRVIYIRCCCLIIIIIITHLHPHEIIMSWQFSNSSSK